MFEVRVSKEIHDIELPTSVKKKIYEIIALLSVDPVPAKRYDIAKIKGRDDMYRLKMGKYRLLYCIDFSNKIVLLFDIVRRKESTYKNI